MDLSLGGRSVLVTGGSSGVGWATARALLAEGANVTICARDGTRLETAGTELVARWGETRVLWRKCDVLEGDEVAELIGAVERRFGRLDALINNAGEGRTGTFMATTDNQWMEELHLKFSSVVLPTRAALPLLKISGGAVVNINAVLGRQPEPHMVATSAARAGLLNLSRSLAREFGSSGVRINTLLLGLISTGQWHRRWEMSNVSISEEEWMTGLARERGVALGRAGKAEEVAAAAVFLASPAASYITGATLEVDGGVARYS